MSPLRCWVTLQLFALTAVAVALSSSAVYDGAIRNNSPFKMSFVVTNHSGGDVTTNCQTVSPLPAIPLIAPPDNFYCTWEAKQNKSQTLLLGIRMAFDEGVDAGSKGPPYRWARLEQAVSCGLMRLDINGVDHSTGKPLPGITVVSGDNWNPACKVLDGNSASGAPFNMSKSNLIVTDGVQQGDLWVQKCPFGDGHSCYEACIHQPNPPPGTSLQGCNDFCLQLCK